MPNDRDKLDALYRVRKRSEDERIGELSRCRSALDVKQREIRQYREERQSHLEQLGAKNSGRLEMNEILDHRRALNAIARFEGAAVVELKLLTHEVLSAQRSLEAAIRERQIVERLQRSKAEKRQLAIQRRESVSLDEVGQHQYRYSREAAQ